MVLNAVVATLALALAQADASPPADDGATPEASPDVEQPAPPTPPAPPPAPPRTVPSEAWNERPPEEPRRTPPLNRDLRNGVVFSAERLFPLVTVQTLGPSRSAPFVDCGVTAVPTNCAPAEPATHDEVHVGPSWDAARSLFDFPALAFDGAISGVTLGGSLTVGQNLASRQTYTATGGLEARRGALGLSPRIGYAVPLGDVFAIWPRVGVAFAVTDTLKDDVTLLFVTTQLGALWFFTRHAALALTPAYHAPMTNERTNASRFAVDLGLTIAF